MVHTHPNACIKSRENLSLPWTGLRRYLPGTKTNPSQGKLTSRHNVVHARFTLHSNRIGGPARQHAIVGRRFRPVRGHRCGAVHGERGPLNAVVQCGDGARRRRWGRGRRYGHNIVVRRRRCWRTGAQCPVEGERVGRLRFGFALDANLFVARNAVLVLLVGLANGCDWKGGEKKDTHTKEKPKLEGKRIIGGSTHRAQTYSLPNGPARDHLQAIQLEQRKLNLLNCSQVNGHCRPLSRAMSIVQSKWQCTDWLCSSFSDCRSGIVLILSLSLVQLEPGS